MITMSVINYLNQITLPMIYGTHPLLKNTYIIKILKNSQIEKLSTTLKKYGSKISLILVDPNICLQKITPFLYKMGYYQMDEIKDGDDQMLYVFTNLIRINISTQNIDNEIF